MWRSDVDTKKGSFTVTLWNDFSGILDGSKIRTDTDEFYTFQDSPHVNRICFMRDTDWGDSSFGEVIRKKGTWHYQYASGSEKYSIDTQETFVTLDLITYLRRSVYWFNRLPALYAVERTANHFHSNRYFFVFSVQHFKQELFAKVIDDFKQVEPGAEIWYYNASDEAVDVTSFDTKTLKKVTTFDRFSFEYAEFQVSSASPVRKQNYYRLCTLLNNVGWNDQKGEFQRYCDSHPDNLFWDKSD